MLHNTTTLYGHKLTALDGEIGHVKDFYFDDKSWVIRYLVADTGSWLTGRLVLLSPHALGAWDAQEKSLHVNLHKARVEHSPSIEMHKPVSRQYELEYYRYYGWPYYWQGEALWGLSGLPILPPPAATSLNEPVATIGPQLARIEAHLRSAQAVKGYELRTHDGAIGYVCDFMMDAGSWAIGQLVIKTGHRFSGKEVLIETKNVSRISYDESTVFASLAVAPTPSSPAAGLVPVAAVA